MNSCGQRVHGFDSFKDLSSMNFSTIVRLIDHWEPNNATLCLFCWHGVAEPEPSEVIPDCKDFLHFDSINVLLRPGSEVNKVNLKMMVEVIGDNGVFGTINIANSLG